MASDTDQAIAEATRWLIEQQLLVRAPKREPLPTPILGGGGMPTVTVAAFDASPISKSKADLICIGVDDQVTFRRASVMAETWGRINLTEGSYSCNVDAVRTWEHFGMISGSGTRSTVIDVTGGGSTDDFIYLNADCELRDVFVRSDAPGRTVHAVGDGFKISQAKIAGGDGPAIRVNAGTNVCWITDCEITCNGAEGIELNSGFQIHIVDCDIQGDTYGVYDSGFGSGIWISGCNIIGQTLAACRFVGADQIHLSGNTLFSNLDGIVGVNNTRFTILGNHILGNTGRGIDLTTCVDPVIEENTITQHNSAAIFLTGCTRPQVDDNHLFDVNRQANDVAAVVIDGTSSAVPSRGGSCNGNDIDATSASGIRILDGYSNMVIDDNKLTRIREHGIWISDLKHSQIHDNHVAWNDNMATNDTFDGIILDGDSDLNSLQQNTVRAEDTSAGTPGTRFGMNIAAATCNDNVMNDNFVYLVSDIQSAPYNDAGTATQGTNFSA